MRALLWTFIVANVVDWASTSYLLTNVGIDLEWNPIAAWTFQHGGAVGLLGFKIVLVAVFCGIVYLVWPNLSKGWQMVVSGSVGATVLVALWGLLQVIMCVVFPYE
jgi:hypothetical protein